MVFNILTFSYLICIRTRVRWIFIYLMTDTIVVTCWWWRILSEQYWVEWKRQEANDKTDRRNWKIEEVFFGERFLVGWVWMFWGICRECWNEVRRRRINMKFRIMLLSGADILLGWGNYTCNRAPHTLDFWHLFSLERRNSWLDQVWWIKCS